ncbi:MAG: DUF502 domain-containing protein [Haloarculaceae archaeon]
MTFGGGFKRNFLAGLVLITPLVVTLYVLRVLVNWSFLLVNPVVRGTRLIRYTANVEAVAQVLAGVLIVLGIAAVGFLAQRELGRQVFGSAGRLVQFIPLVNVIYSSTRQVAKSLADRETRYESVVLVEHPREGLYSVGLVTGESPAAVESVTDEPACNVFLPNSPNPTAGRLAVVPESQVHEIDMSVRRGMRFLVTTGLGAEESARALPPLDSPEGSDAD